MDIVSDAAPVGTSLDDYFDRLDAAFSASAGGDAASPFSELQSAPVPTPTLEMPTLDSFTFASLPAEPATESPLAALAAMESVEDGPSVLPTLDDLLAGMPAMVDDTMLEGEELVGRFAALDATVPEAPSPSVHVPVTDLLDQPVSDSGSFEMSSAAPARSLIADAFTAFLAVEQGEPGAMPVRLVQDASGAPAMTDAVVDDVARRVLQRLSFASTEPFGSLVREIGRAHV